MNSAAMQRPRVPPVVVLTAEQRAIIRNVIDAGGRTAIEVVTALRNAKRWCR